MKNSGFSYKLLDLYVDSIQRNGLGPSHVASRPGKQLQCILHGRRHHIDNTERGIAFRSCTDSSLCYTQTFFLLKKRRSENVNRTNVSTISMEPVKKHYLQRGKGSLRVEIYLSFNKSKRETERHRETTRRRAGPRGVEGWGGTSAGMNDMCVCANLYKYHNKKHDVAAPAVKRRKWAPGVGVQGFWVFVCSLFLSVLLFNYFLLCIRGWWVLK